MDSSRIYLQAQLKFVGRNFSFEVANHQPSLRGGNVH
jgi:hypothetical protein